MAEKCEILLEIDNKNDKEDRYTSNTINPSQNPKHPKVKTIGSSVVSNRIKNKKRINIYRNVILVIEILMVTIYLAVPCLLYYIQFKEYENNLNEYFEEYESVGIPSEKFIYTLKWSEKKFNNFILKSILTIMSVMGHRIFFNFLSKFNATHNIQMDSFIMHLYLIYNSYNIIPLAISFTLISTAIFCILGYFLYLKIMKSGKLALFLISLLFAVSLANNVDFLFNFTKMIPDERIKLHDYFTNSSEKQIIIDLLVKYNVKIEDACVSDKYPDKYAFSAGDFFGGKVIFDIDYISKINFGETVGVLLHELGHLKYKHCLSRIYGLTFILLFKTVISISSYFFVEKYSSSAETIFFMILQLKMIEFVEDIITNKFIIQPEEFEADKNAFEHGYGKEMIGGLMVIVKNNAPYTYTVNPSLEILSTHPSLKRRIQKYQEYLSNK